jgi:hypothetical protein
MIKPSPQIFVQGYSILIQLFSSNNRLYSTSQSQNRYFYLLAALRIKTTKFSEKNTIGKMYGRPKRIPTQSSISAKEKLQNASSSVHAGQISNLVVVKE